MNNIFIITGTCNIVPLPSNLFIVMERETIVSFLNRLGLSDEVDAFRKQDVNLNVLLQLDETLLVETLHEMNLTLGKRMVIRNEIKIMKSRKFFFYFVY